MLSKESGTFGFFSSVVELKEKKKLQSFPGKLISSMGLTAKSKVKIDGKVLNFSELRECILKKDFFTGEMPFR